MEGIIARKRSGTSLAAASPDKTFLIKALLWIGTEAGPSLWPYKNCTTTKFVNHRGLNRRQSGLLILRFYG